MFNYIEMAALKYKCCCYSLLYYGRIGLKVNNTVNHVRVSPPAVLVRYFYIMAELVATNHEVFQSGYFLITWPVL